MQDGSDSLVSWLVQIPGKIITELSVRRFDHQETGDLEGARAPPAAEGDWCWCTVGKHRYPLSLEEGQRSCSQATYHRHGNTPLGACHWRTDSRHFYNIVTATLSFARFVCTQEEESNAALDHCRWRAIRWQTSGYATWFTARGAHWWRHNSETITYREKRRPPRPMKSSEISNGENHIAVRQLLQNRKLHHLWRHNLGSRWKLQKNGSRENFIIGAFYNITKNQDNPIKTVGRDSFFEPQNP